MTILASLLLHGVTALTSSMSILSLTFFRRHQKQGPLERLESEPPGEDCSGVVGRLERMLVTDLPPNEATPLTAGNPSDPLSAHPRDDELAGASLGSEAKALEDVSVVSVMAPPEVMAPDEVQVEAPSPQAPTNNDPVLALPSPGFEPETSPGDIEVRLMAGLDDAHTEREARRLAEQERDHVRHGWTVSRLSSPTPSRRFGPKPCYAEEQRLSSNVSKRNATAFGKRAENS